MLHWLPLLLTMSAPTPRWEPARTWALVAGVVSWRDPRLPAFEGQRRDVDLMHSLARSGVPEAQRTLLIDGEATRHGVLAALADHVTTAPNGSTFIVYFEGHGLVDGARFVLGTADTDLDALERTGLDLAALYPVLALRGASDRVLLLGDACYAGNLAALAAALTYSGVPTVSLTSAAEASESSTNWTFTQALIDGLDGRAIIDVNQDGDITLTEIAHEARLAMRYRERQPIGFAPLGFADLVLTRAQPWPADLAALDGRGQRFGRGDWIVARRLDGQRSVGRVLGARSDDDAESPPAAGPATKLRVEYYDHAERTVTWALEDRADPVVMFAYPVGTRLRVRDRESLYEAVVERVEDELQFVRLGALISGEDRAYRPDALFVTPDQVVAALGDADKDRRVLVEDNGAVFEAIVKARIGGEVCLRYPGAPFTQDDCVDDARVSRDTRAP